MQANKDVAQRQGSPASRRRRGPRRTGDSLGQSLAGVERSIWTFYETGFTLLEIMVALAIIGGLLVTVLYSLNYHLGIAEKHEFVTVATMLAKNKMSEMDQIPAATNGEFPDPYSGYHYETGIKASPYQGISEIWVTVSKNSDNVKLSELKEIMQTGTGQ